MTRALRVLFVDNFDSFSYNVVHLLASRGGAPDVLLNDDPRLEPEILERYDALVVGPGPGRPEHAPQMMAVLRAAIERGVPVLGVCLGLQAIGEVMGATVTHAPRQMHGKTSRIEHDGSGVFAGLASPLTATRYHSLCLEPSTIPETLRVNARSEDGVVQGVAHRERPVHGVQFHPESVLSESGDQIVENFLSQCHPTLMEFAPLLRRVLGGEDLAAEEAAAFVGEIMDASFTPVQAAALLTALAFKGESVDEIVGAARAMRERSLHVEHGLPMVVDVVGTGGDHANTINISTMAALVVAAAGVPVAKHGNRAASSACGSADVLESAGFPIEVSPELAARMLRECGFTFMFAPYYHPAMRNAASIRRELGVRTIFNLLGPLTNPARATHQIVGVAREELVERVGPALRALGARRGAVVHGCSGLDEVAGDAPTLIYSFDEDGARLWRLEPSEFGIAGDLRTPVGGSVGICRDAFVEILHGGRSAAADVVALNAAVVFYVVGVESELLAAFERARALLRSGAAWQIFERAKKIGSHG